MKKVKKKKKRAIPFGAVDMTADAPVDDSFIDELVKKRPMTKTERLVKARAAQKKPPSAERQEVMRVMRKIKHMTKVELLDLANLLIGGTYDELKARAEDPSASVMMVMLASSCVKAIARGDYQVVDKILDRLIGRTKEEVDHTVNVQNPPQVIVHLPSNGREVKD